MRKWTRYFVLSIMVLFSLWVVFTLLHTYSSPVLAQSLWIEGIEARDPALVSKWSQWEGRHLKEEEATLIIQTLHRHPELKKKIYKEIQRQALFFNRGDNRQSAWIELKSNPQESAYNIVLPSIYLQLDSPFKNQMRLYLNSNPYAIGDQPIGPLLPIDYQIELDIPTRAGSIQKNLSLEFHQQWGKTIIEVSPNLQYKFLTINAPSTGGYLYLNGIKWGEIKGTETIGPLPNKEYRASIEKDFPWGTIRSEELPVAKNDHEIELNYMFTNHQLIEQIGEAIVEFVNGWTNAAKYQDPTYLTTMSTHLRESMELMILRSDSYFAGDFVQAVIFPSTLEITEEGNDRYILRVLVSEEYVNSRWISADGSEAAPPEDHQYWLYTLKYFNGKWEVDDYFAWEGSLPELSEGIAFHGGQVLRLGVDASFPPFEYRDGQNRLQGFDVELMEWIGESLGIEVFWNDLPINELLSDPDRLDGIDGIISAIDPKLYDRNLSQWDTIPYLDLQEQVLIQNPKLDISNWPDRVKVIGILINSPSLRRVESWVQEKKGRELKLYSEVSHAYEALKQGEIEALVVFPYELKSIALEGLDGSFHTWDQLNRQEFYILLRKELADIKHKIIQMLHDESEYPDGRYQQLIKRYFPKQLPKT